MMYLKCMDDCTTDTDYYVKIFLFRASKLLGEKSVIVSGDYSFIPTRTTNYVEITTNDTFIVPRFENID